MGHPALEEVLLGPVLAEHRAAFTVSYGSNAGILENFLEPRSETWLLLRVLAQCRDLGLHEAGLDLASRLERAWRSGQLQLSWREAARLHSDGAALAWDSGRPEVAARAELRLAELIEQAPAVAHSDESARERSTHRQTVALCMIVRDEAAIIDRCLESVRGLIDTWVIVDTGSLDDTPRRIETVLRGIPGTLHKRAWRNFGHNRTELMELAQGAADYLLLLDADMTLELSVEVSELNADAYLLRHAGSLDYAIPRLVRGDRPWHYIGTTHEYLAWEGDRSMKELNGMHVVHHGDGSSHVVKLDRDRALLERELEDKPDDPRTLFYLARTCADLGDDEAAIGLLRRRVEADGWDEEVFYAQFQLGTLLARVDWEAGARALLDAWQRRPTRAEPLYELARGWRSRGRHDLAFQYASRGLELPYPTDLLFVHREPYEYGLRFERAIAAYYLGELETALADNDALLTSGVPSELEAWVRHNRSWCLRRLKLHEDTPPRAPLIESLQVSNEVPYLDDLIPLTRLTLVSIPTLEQWPSMNPSIAAARDGTLRMIVRTVNYRLGHPNSSYRFLDPDGVVRTRNYLVDVDPSSLIATGVRPLAMVPGVDSLPSPVVGLEDARLVESQDRWMVSATVRDRNEEWRCEMALVDLDNDQFASTVRVLRSPFGEAHEKNWMPFWHQGALHLVYSVGPTIVLHCDEHTNELSVRARHAAPTWASPLRGGSQGLPVADGYLFVVHEVRWRDGQRDYLHRLVHLDGTMRFDAASAPFRFLAPGIEFCAGIAADRRRPDHELRLGGSRRLPRSSSS